ncbi:hypothetical protein LINGRAPRIM_LOCUS1770 [Linum grandiflorum]
MQGRRRKQSGRHGQRSGL